MSLNLQILVQLSYYSQAMIHLLTLSISFPLSVSLVCLPQSSGQCTAQLFSRWSVMIRQLLEAVTLLKCSTAVSSWSTMLKCPQRALEQWTVSWNKLLQIQPLHLSLSTSKQADSRLFSFFFCLTATQNEKPNLCFHSDHTFMKKGASKVLQRISISHFSRGLNKGV